VRVEFNRAAKLPQFFADMMGWQKQADVVAGVFQSLPRRSAKAAILTRNYGQAGRIEYFGPSYGLLAPSAAQQLLPLGAQQYTGEVVISCGNSNREVAATLHHIELAGIIRSDLCHPRRKQYPIYICREPKMTLQKPGPV